HSFCPEHVWALVCDNVALTRLGVGYRGLLVYQYVHELSVRVVYFVGCHLPSLLMMSGSLRNLFANQLSKSSRVSWLTNSALNGSCVVSSCSATYVTTS